MFFLIVFSVWGLILFHIFWRTQSLLQLQGWTRAAFGLGFFLAGFAYVGLRIIFAGRPGDPLERTLLNLSALVVGFIAVLWTLIAVFDLASIVGWLLRLLGAGGMHLLSGRHWAGVLWATAIVLTLFGFVFARSTPSLTRLQVTAPGIEAMRFAVISDSHLGKTASASQWERTLEATLEEAPDVVLIPGDLVGDASTRSDAMVGRLREYFPSEPILVTTGNHDLYSGDGQFGELCSKYGFRPLRQEIEPIGRGIQVAGIDDAHLIDPQRAAEQIRSRFEGMLLVLSHRPGAAHLFADRDQTLVISGHTHGGQTLPMVFLVSIANGRFKSGLYEVGRSFLYVSKGTGVWGPPVRLLANPEVVIIDLVPGPTFGAAVSN